MEIERLTTIFDADDSKAEAAYNRMNKRALDYRAAVRDIKTNFSFNVPSVSGNARELREVARLQIDIARGERAVEQAKRAALQTDREQLKLERERAQLQNKTSSKSPVDNAMRAALTDIKKMQVETTNANRVIEFSEKELTRVVEREAKEQSAARTREIKRSANQAISEIGKIGKAEEKALKQNSLKKSGSSKPDSSFLSNKSSAFLGGIAGGTIGAGASQIAGELVQLTKDGRDAYLTMEKLVRFTATLDKNFQTPQGLKKLGDDIAKLSLEVPQKAEDIAKASFVIKSAYQDMSEPELISFLKELSVAATGSNSTIDAHAEKVAALASQYGVTKKELGEFNALIASSLGQALAKDDEVLSGLNRLIVPARAAKISLTDLMAAMSTVQAVSSDAAENTTMLKDAIEKLGDGKTIERLKETLDINRFNADGSLKPLNEVINEISQSLARLPSDAQKYAAINDIFKDVRARSGILALVENIDKYNASLKEGANQDVFVNKNTTMLNSAEARWTKFNNYISQLQRTAGGELDKVLSSAVSGESTQTNARNFFLNLGGEIVKGGGYVTNEIAVIGVNLAEAMANLVGAPDPSYYENERNKLQKQLEDFYVNVDNQTQAKIDYAREQDKKYYESIANNPAASDALKASAQKKLAIITQNMQSDYAAAAQNNFDNWKKIADEAVKGLASSDSEISNQAKLTVKNLNAELNSALGDQRYSDEMKNQIREMWKSLPAISADEIKNGKPAVDAAVNDLTQISPEGARKSGETAGNSIVFGLVGALLSKKPEIQQTQEQSIKFNDLSFAQQAGMMLGGMFGAGVVAGIQKWFAPAQAVVRGMIGAQFEAGKQAQDSHSPSRRAARELGVPFVQGIEVGIESRAKNLHNKVANLVNSSMFAKPGGKGKTPVAGAGQTSGRRAGRKGRGGEKDESVRERIQNLEDAASGIDREAARSEAATKRFYDAILEDRTAGEDTEINRVNAYFKQLYETENQSYQDRINNIAQREAEIGNLKNIKPADRAREISRLQAERASTDESHEQKVFDLHNGNGGGVLEAAMREVDHQKRIFARQLKIDSFTRDDTHSSAEKQVETEYADKFRLIEQEIGLLEKNRSNFAAGSKERIELENKIKDKFEERADLEIEKGGDLKKAREDDKKSYEDFAKSLEDLTEQTIDSETRAEEARIQMLEASGAKQETIRQAKLDLAIKEENIEHDRQTRQIEAAKKSLLNLATTEDQKLQIEKNYNAQIEAENSRHEAAVGTAQADNSPKKNSIKSRLDEAVAALPGYRQQFADFAVDIPNQLANAFTNGLQSWDGTWKGFFSSIKNAFLQTIQEMVAELLRSQLVKLISSLVGSLVGGLSGGGSAGAHTSGSGAIHGFASGGFPETNRVSLVGEQGPELFVPRTAGKIYTHDETKKMLSGAGGGGSQTVNNVTINQNFKSPRNLVAPKSTKQQSEAALLGASRGLKGSN